MWQGPISHIGGAGEGEGCGRRGGGSSGPEQGQSTGAVIHGQAGAPKGPAARHTSFGVTGSTDAVRHPGPTGAEVERHAHDGVVWVRSSSTSKPRGGTLPGRRLSVPGAAVWGFGSFSASVRKDHQMFWGSRLLGVSRRLTVRSWAGASWRRRTGPGWVPVSNNGVLPHWSAPVVAMHQDR